MLLLGKAAVSRLSGCKITGGCGGKDGGGTCGGSSRYSILVLLYLPNIDFDRVFFSGTTLIKGSNRG